jgi:hypothetical protein
MAAQTLSYKGRIFIKGIETGFTLAASIISDAKSETAADAISVSERFHQFAPAAGVFADDPTWDNFMSNIEDYGRYIDSLERTSED